MTIDDLCKSERIQRLWQGVATLGSKNPDDRAFLGTLENGFRRAKRAVAAHHKVAWRDYEGWVALHPDKEIGPEAEAIIDEMQKFLDDRSAHKKA